MKIAIVVQRYGADINGGAEQHARYIAEHLATHVQVEVLTTCASDYVSWRNERPAGVESVHGVPVRRFPVARERDPKDFAEWSTRVFGQAHSITDELAWLEAEGPTSPALVDHIRTHADQYDFFVFFSYRYYHAYHGIRAVPGKAILVPTAERDAALGLGIFAPIFRAVRACMYNSYEERALIQAAAGNRDVPGVVVGVGSEIPEDWNAARFRQKFGLRDRFAIYVGRIDENKGCKELFDFFEHYSSTLVDGLHLVLIGTPIIPVPSHPRIHHLGYVTDPDKFDAIAASELLVMPSYFESLSMAALEAWALGKPVLANAKCDVLQGQCLRSNGGLFYNGFHEFYETLRTIDGNQALSATLGRNGKSYFDSHYTWPVIVRKYTDMLDRLSREPAAGSIAPLPGWWGRRRRVLEPADTIVAGLPAGPASSAEVIGRPAADRERRPAPVESRREPVPSPLRQPRTDLQERSVSGQAESRGPSPAVARQGTPAPSPSPRPRGNHERRGPQGRPAREPRPDSPAQPSPPPQQSRPADGANGESRDRRRRPFRGRRRPGGGR